MKTEKPDEVLIPDSKLTRNELMFRAKEKGVKNFRVLNKKELEKVIEDISQDEIDSIVSGAVARWKNGWGKKK